tara:strand:+ start:190 stop:1518 length:1329 start_codon:yes stop_codon:yes gene_type:complete
MNNFDLNISNYSIDDLKTFLNIDALTFDYADLQKKVKTKTAQIMGIERYDNKEKKKLIKFVNQINLRLVEQIKLENKIEEFHTNPSLEIKNPTTNYEFPPHKKESSNQHETKTIISHLSIDTKFRKNHLFTKSTDFYIDLPVALKNILSMRMESFEINNTIYNISSEKKTNKIYVKKTTSGSIITEATIIIPDGYYTKVTLATYLNRLGGSLNNIGVRIEFNESTHKTRIYAVDGSGNDETTSVVEVSFDYEMQCGESNIAKSQEQFKEPLERNLNTRIRDPNAAVCNPCPPGSKIEPDASKLEKRITMTSLGWLLGFRKENYNGEFEYISSCFYDFNMVKYMFLCVDDFQKSMHEVVKVVYQDSFLQKNILARIPLDGDINNKFLAFHETDTVRKRNYFGPVTIKRLHIQLIDEYGELLNLNNQDFSFNLEFEILYERNIY